MSRRKDDIESLRFQLEQFSTELQRFRLENKAERAEDRTERATRQLEATRDWTRLLANVMTLLVTVAALAVGTVGILGFSRYADFQTAVQKAEKSADSAGRFANEIETTLTQLNSKVAAHRYQEQRIDTVSRQTKDRLDQVEAAVRPLEMQVASLNQQLQDLGQSITLARNTIDSLQAASAQRSDWSRGLVITADQSPLQTLGLTGIHRLGDSASSDFISIPPQGRINGSQLLVPPSRVSAEEILKFNEALSENRLTPCTVNDIRLVTISCSLASPTTIPSIRLADSNGTTKQ